MIELIWLDEDRFVALGSKNMVVEHVRSSLKAPPKTLANEFNQRLTACLLDGLIDVQEDFQCYFRDEFAEIEQYLRGVQGLSRDLIEDVRKKKPLNDLTIGKVYLSGDRGMSGLISSKMGAKILGAIFTVKEKTDEDES